MKLKEQLKLCKTPFQKKCVNILMYIYWKDYETDVVIPSCDIKQEKNLYFKLWDETSSKDETLKSETFVEAPYKIWDFIIVRTYYAGVIYWKYMWRTEYWILLHDSRRLYYRNSKQWISLSELSIYWIKSDSKVTEPVNIELTDPTLCEILIPTKECKESIDNQPKYKA
jgi:hypothetical protein